MNRNPESPWNPADPLEIYPEEYEKVVLRWLSNASTEGKVKLCLRHRQKIEGHGGNYEIDVVVEFSLFGGAVIKVIVECKRHRRPVERDDVMAFAMKIQTTASHKGMMFSTSGFQRGAIKFANSQGIALVTFVDGKFTYETRHQGPTQDPPSWVDLPNYAGLFFIDGGNGFQIRRVTIDELDPIVEWIKA